MSRHLVLIGAGYHSKVVVDILLEQDKKITAMVDDNYDLHGKSIMGVEVLGYSEAILNFNSDDTELIITIGNPVLRKKFFDYFSERGYRFASAVHPDSSISRYARLKSGVVINAGARIHPDAEVQDNVIIGLNATVSHDAGVGRHSHLAPGVRLASESVVKEAVDLGLNASVIPGKRIGEFAIIGAGAVITKDIPPHCTAVGIPAKPIKYHRDEPDTEV